jgi:dTDP-L-rhamnose 4-epimerase
MAKNILITGGAGFIGSHLSDELLQHGHRVRVLDSLDPQVHQSCSSRPAYLNSAVELIVGDVRDRSAVTKALHGIDVVYHFAAAVGVGQSMYQIARYNSVNALGTAVLLEEIAKREIERMIVASSMSVYGEGLYESTAGEIVTDAKREAGPSNRHGWELRDRFGHQLIPLPTPESKPISPQSIYALSKYGQERMCLCTGEAYRIPTVALRFFNAYGPRQALSNPYTGVLAIFSAQLLNNERPMVFEDGLQSRDFVSVKDIAKACRLAIEAPRAAGQVINIGSGRPSTIVEIACELAEAVGRPEVSPAIMGKMRAGDVRHCFANISCARNLLGYEPQVNFKEGLSEFAEWLAGQTAADNTSRASAELIARGLAV